MAFCSLPCWTYFSAVLRTFCLLNPNNAIECELQTLVLNTKVLVKTSSMQSRDVEPVKRSGESSRVLLRGSSPLSADGPTGQGQLYVWTSGTVWLPRVTKRECTTGLPRESGGVAPPALCPVALILILMCYGDQPRGGVFFRDRT